MRVYITRNLGKSYLSFCKGKYRGRCESLDYKILQVIDWAGSKGMEYPDLEDLFGTWGDFNIVYRDLLKGGLVVEK